MSALLVPNLPASLNLVTSMLWQDEFNVDLGQWFQDTFEEDDLHRTKYKHLELDGSINLDLEGIKVAGRHAALMNGFRDKVQFLRDKNLILRQYIDDSPNPYRDNILGRNGVQLPFGNMTPYAPWLSTWTRKWSERHLRHITDWTKPVMTFGKGSVVEVSVNFEKQCMDGVRWSAWAMGATQGGVIDTPENPAQVVAGTEYDSNPIVVEIDFPEVECPSTTNPSYGAKASMKVVGGKTGDTENGTKDLLAEFGIDLRKGDHTFTLRWLHDGTLEFWVDGQLINTDMRGVDMQAYLILSAEMCSGIKVKGMDNIQPHENFVVGYNPKIPRNPGLTGRCWIDSRHLVDQHEVVIHYVRLWSIDAVNGKDKTPCLMNVNKDFARPVTPYGIGNTAPENVRVAEIGNDDTAAIKLMSTDNKVAKVLELLEESYDNCKRKDQQILILKQLLEEATKIPAVVARPNNAVSNDVANKVEELLIKARSRRKGF